MVRITELDCIISG